MKQLFFRGVVLSALVLSLSNCKKGSSNGDGGGTPAPSGPDINLASSATLGQYLTNNKGQALYLFSDEVDGANACTGDCAAIWPEFTADLSTVTLNAGLSITDFETITTASGKKQVTYKGWPLHTYSPLSSGGYGGGTSNVPEGGGTTLGDGFAGLWFVAKPDYTIMLADKQLKGLDGNNYKSDFTLGTGNTVYFTNGVGRTVYTFSLDSFNINKFTKADLTNNNLFPIFEQTQVVVPSVLDKSLFGNIEFAGKQQLTYKGWPLHFFGQDSLRGLTLAVSIAPAGKWAVAVKNVADPKGK
jgi:predicted lipoprotein with Yx(FWY)xxD motif